MTDRAVACRYKKRYGEKRAREAMAFHEAQGLGPVPPSKVGDLEALIRQWGVTAVLEAFAAAAADKTVRVPVEWAKYAIPRLQREGEATATGPPEAPRRTTGKYDHLISR